MSEIDLSHPMITRQDWSAFTPSCHATWQTLFERQHDLLQERACSEIMDGIKKLEICNDQIPNFDHLNAILEAQTGFSIIAVKGFIPEKLFFECLRDRIFPSTCFIRKPEQLDYLQEPDIFHDIFGHVPLLVNPIFADFMQAFGAKGVQACEYGLDRFAATLYWFTIEFGLIRTQQGLRIYGAGITSSRGESVYSLDSDIPVRLRFDMLRLLKTRFHIDSFQKTYFVIDSFEQLFEAVDKLDWNEVKETCLHFPDIVQGISINEEEIYHDKL